MPPLADIALPVPLDHTFTYIVPPELQARCRLGCRVLVPFGRKTAAGVVVNFPSATAVKNLKPIHDVLDPIPSFSDEMLKLARWMSEYYLTPLGEVLKAAAPHGLAAPAKQMVRLVPPFDATLPEIPPKAKKQKLILETLRKHGTLPLSQLAKKAGVRTIHSLINEMSEKGWLEVSENIEHLKLSQKFEKIVTPTLLGEAALSSEESDSLTPKQKALLTAMLETKSFSQNQREVLKRAGSTLSILKSLEKRGYVTVSERESIRSSFEVNEVPPDITLNSHQQRALDEILKGAESEIYQTYLLYGITGSGKTQVYIEAIKTLLPKGKTAIVLVPEISLTPQIVRRFMMHFGNDVAVMHSQMSTGERHDAWRLARDGRAKVVIGPRSAIFAPLSNIGLIVVDEEHEASYKQFDATPRYHARDVAIVRASQANAIVILGSATPSAESYQNALSGKYKLLELPTRIDGAMLPRIEIVDMTKEKTRRYEETKKEVQEKNIPFPKRLPQSSVSKLLYDHILQRIDKKEGVILLQNRRGFSHVVECYDCGYVEKCDRCEVTLTFHTTKKHLRCHYCGFVKKPPTICPKCNGIDIRLHAFGTQQVEEELRTLFPDSTILRMDLDTTGRKGAHDHLLRQFESGEADILLGTQMVAKGLDFPRVTLVGVISADTQMLLPDFRASERTFQLLTQVAGRAGRSTLAGEVIVQTLQPDHYSLKHVVTHDFRNFYREELEYRRELDYPPFSRIGLIEFKGARENEVHHHAKKFVEYLTDQKLHEYLVILGPADAAIPKIRNQFRKHIVIKALKEKDATGFQLRTALLKARKQYESSPLGKIRTVQMTIDIDPVGMM